MDGRKARALGKVRELRLKAFWKAKDIDEEDRHRGKQATGGRRRT